MRALLTLSLLSLMGCDADKVNDKDSGIGVGNPPMAELRSTPATSTGIGFTALNFPVSSIYIEDCDGVGITEERTADLDLSGDIFLSVPAGHWCALGLISSEPVVLQGQTSNGGQFNFTTDLGRLMVYGEVDLPSSDEATAQLVLELGYPDWIDEAGLGLAPPTPWTWEPIAWTTRSAPRSGPRSCIARPCT
jgi:hypothetical protein